jgi:hypothetical protein
LNSVAARAARTAADYKCKVGCGTRSRARMFAAADGQPRYLFAMPHGLPSSCDVADLQGRMVLVGVETAMTLVHMPVAARLLGNAMFGEPMSDRKTSGKLDGQAGARSGGLAERAGCACGGTACAAI